MTPDIDVRLQSVIKAIEQVILPAVDPNNPLAREQATVAIGHLQMIRGQWQYLTDYVAGCLLDLTRLGFALIGAADGGARTVAAAAALDSHLSTADSAQHEPSYTLSRRRETIAVRIDDLIKASAVDGSAKFREECEDLVLDYGVRQTERDRAWYKASGLDPDYANLPAPAELVNR
ncbi:MAG: hypothetical protein ABW034_02080 [Steroidobacteraceae bacterium]